MGMVVVYPGCKCRCIKIRKTHPLSTLNQSTNYTSPQTSRRPTMDSSTTRWSLTRETSCPRFALKGIFLRLCQVDVVWMVSPPLWVNQSTCPFALYSQRTLLESKSNSTRSPMLRLRRLSNILVPRFVKTNRSSIACLLLARNIDSCCWESTKLKTQRQQRKEMLKSETVWIRSCDSRRRR